MEPVLRFCNKIHFRLRLRAGTPSHPRKDGPWPSQDGQVNWRYMSSMDENLSAPVRQPQSCFQDVLQVGEAHGGHVGIPARKHGNLQH
eukprot:1950362-Amphidinium_carterae.1